MATLRQRQLAMYKRQPPRTGRPFGKKNRERQPSLRFIRNAVYELIRLGNSPKLAVKQIDEWYGKDAVKKAIEAYRDDYLNVLISGR